jgi:hypothetical protein
LICIVFRSEVSNTGFRNNIADINLSLRGYQFYKYFYFPRSFLKKYIIYIKI